MSKLLEQAVKRLKTLPQEDQDALASLILQEIEDEENWRKSFSDSSNILAKMADKAMIEYRAGLTKELDPDNL